MVGYNTQQNRVVKRKNRTIVDMTRVYTSCEGAIKVLLGWSGIYSDKFD